MLEFSEWQPAKRQIQFIRQVPQTLFFFCFVSHEKTTRDCDRYSLVSTSLFVPLAAILGVILRAGPDAVVALLLRDLASLPGLFCRQALSAVLGLALPALIVAVEGTRHWRYEGLYRTTAIVVIIYASYVTFSFTETNPLNVMRVRFILTYRILQVSDHLVRRSTGRSVVLRPRETRASHYRGLLRHHYDLGRIFAPALEQFLIAFREPRLDSFDKSYARTPAESWQQEVVHILWTGMCITTINVAMDHMIVRTLLLAWCIYAYLTLVVFLMTPYSSPPFHRPFFACSISDFWKLRWHSLLHSPLHTVAYKPVLRATGSKAAAILSTFLLSGIWHAVGFEAVLGLPSAICITAFFLLMGVGVLIDGACNLSNRSKIISRFFGWVWILGLASLTLSIVLPSEAELTTLLLNCQEAGVGLRA